MSPSMKFDIWLLSYFFPSFIFSKKLNSAIKFSEPLNSIFSLAVILKILLVFICEGDNKSVDSLDFISNCDHSLYTTYIQLQMAEFGHSGLASNGPSDAEQRRYREKWGKEMDSSGSKKIDNSFSFK